MSKKKMVAAEFNTVSTDSSGKPVETPVQADVNATVYEKAMDAAGNDKVPATVRSKLEEFEKMERTVSSLAKENEALKDKLAEYLEELTSLRSAEPKTVEIVKEVVKEVPVEKVVEKIVNADSQDLANLKSEIDALRNENDSYLMRISELTFENAKLTASMSEMEKNVQTQPSEKQHHIAAIRQPVCQPTSQLYSNVYRNSNGYTSWN